MVKRALCVGCNYPSKAFGLAGSVNDAFLIAECLQDHCGFEADNVCVLHDVYPGQKKSTKVDPCKKPTRVNILQKLQWLVRSSKAGDVLFFSFSGYGLQVDDMDGYQDEGYDEAILPTDFVDGRDGDYSVIVTGDIHDVLLGIAPNCSVTVLMDCDHATSVIDVSGTLDGQLVNGLKFNVFCGLKAHTTKMQLAVHNREVWQEEQARAVKARPRFQPMMEIDNPRKGRLPTRPAMSRASPVAFCYSAAGHGQTAMELQVNRVIDGKDTPRQHGILSWCFVQAFEELNYDCSHVALCEATKRRMMQIKEKDLPRMDQDVTLTFSTPTSNPFTMKACQPVDNAFNGVSQPSRMSGAAPAVVPPPPPGFIHPTGPVGHGGQMTTGAVIGADGQGGRGSSPRPPSPRRQTHEVMQLESAPENWKLAAPMTHHPPQPGDYPPTPNGGAANAGTHGQPLGGSGGYNTGRGPLARSTESGSFVMSAAGDCVYAGSERGSFPVQSSFPKQNHNHAAQAVGPSGRGPGDDWSHGHNGPVPGSWPPPIHGERQPVPSDRGLPAPSERGPSRDDQFQGDSTQGARHRLPPPPPAPSPPAPAALPPPPPRVDSKEAGVRGAAASREVNLPEPPPQPGAADHRSQPVASSDYHGLNSSSRQPSQDFGGGGQMAPPPPWFNQPSAAPYLGAANGGPVSAPPSMLGVPGGQPPALPRQHSYQAGGVAAQPGYPMNGLPPPQWFGAAATWGGPAATVPAPYGATGAQQQPAGMMPQTAMQGPQPVRTGGHSYPYY